MTELQLTALCLISNDGMTIKDLAKAIAKIKESKYWASYRLAAANTMYKLSDLCLVHEYMGTFSITDCGKNKIEELLPARVL